MRKIIFSLIFVVLLASFVSADILINQQPENLYNLGDVLTIPIKIVATQDIANFFTVNLLCGGTQTEIHKEYISLITGDERQISSSIPLIKNFIGRSEGTCKIKTILGEEFVLSKDFTISNKITVTLKESKPEFAPEENIIVEGDAIKETGDAVQGFVNLKLISNAISENIEVIDTVNNGYFYINFTLPADTPAGQYLVSVNVYEKDAENTTNNGFVDYNMLITQVPTSLEIVLENDQIDPGENMQIRTVLHDQTGIQIDSNSVISIKNQANLVLEQKTIPTTETYEYLIPKNQVPENWTIFAVSNQLNAEKKFKINAKPDIKIELINKTLIITNTGNVPYNDTVFVKIGEKIVEVKVYLELGKTDKFTLSAPDGEYEVEIITEAGTQVSERVMLTGNAISVKDAREGIIKIARYPIVWVFIVAILGFIAYLIFKKGYKRSFFGYINSKKKGKPFIPLQKNSLVKTQNRAELSLSLKGDKQDVSLICLKIKNLEEIQSKKSNAEETLQNIVNTAEEDKALIYENQGNIFFILAPVSTRTFKNEKPTLNLAQKIKSSLVNYNKLAKQKIYFGIALNHGAIIAKQEKDSVKFMSLGTLITSAKKIAQQSDGAILLSEKINDKLRDITKTEKHEKDNTTFYAIKAIKNNSENKQFINKFIQRLEGKK